MLRFFWALFRTNLKASLALRTAFWLQVAFMALNNALFFVVWWIIFERFEEIRGFRVEDMAALYGVAAAGYGFAAVFAGGLPELGKTIDDGNLDPILSQPKSVLLQAASARTNPSGWGDILSGVVMIAWSGHVGLVSIPVAVLAVTLSTATFFGSGVVLHSTTFFIGRLGGLARQVGDFLLTFAVYPPTLFGGALKVFLFTVLPAGLISYLPVELLREFDPGVAAAAIAGTTAYVTVAIWLFHRGLRVYTSGSRFSVRR